MFEWIALFAMFDQTHLGLKLWHERQQMRSFFPTLCFLFFLLTQKQDYWKILCDILLRVVSELRISEHLILLKACSPPQDLIQIHSFVFWMFQLQASCWGFGPAGLFIWKCCSGGGFFFICFLWQLAKVKSYIGTAKCNPLLLLLTWLAVKGVEISSLLKSKITHFTGFQLKCGETLEFTKYSFFLIIQKFVGRFLTVLAWKLRPSSSWMMGRTGAQRWSWNWKWDNLQISSYM